MRVFRLFFGWIYKKIIKPLLFRLSPDDAHNYLISVAKVWQRIPGLRQLTRVLLAYRYDDRLRQKIAGIDFSNPVGISAGFDKNIELQPTIHMIGCGFETGGSITRYPRRGNDRPWFHRLPKTKSLVVHAGLANDGLDEITSIVERDKAVQNKMPLIISVAVAACDSKCTISQSIEEACDTLLAIQNKKLAQAVEVNISCPNAQDGQPFTQPKNLETLMVAIGRLKLELPIFVKMPNKQTWSEFEPILDIVAKHNIQGVTISNLVKDRETVNLKDELPDDIKGCLSGKPTSDRSNLLIRETYRKYGDKLVIIGVGGIFSAEDAYEKIKNGASLVALITGMIFEGPQLVGDINNGLARLARSEGYDNISQAVGSIQSAD